MCLGMPGKVLEVLPGKPRAVVESFGLQSLVGTSLVGEVKPGDYLLVHAGYAIEKLDLARAEDQIRLLEELEHVSGAE